VTPARILLLPVVAAVLSTGTVSAQTAASRIVLATIADAGGRPLTDLGEDDFVVHESDQLREILSVRLADYPIVLVVDNIDTAARDLDALRRAASRFMARIGRERAVAIGAVAHPATMLTSFEDDRASAAAAIEGLDSHPSGTDPHGNAVLRSIGNAARAIRATEAPFSAIIVVSAADLDVPATPDGDWLNPVQTGRTAVHVIARTEAGSARAVGTLGDALRVLSDQTRGQFTAIFSIVSYQAALDRLADRLSSEMMIEFIEPPGAVPGDDVKVGVRIPGARVTGLGVSR
jgi:hypothetical protein